MTRDFTCPKCSHKQKWTHLISSYGEPWNCGQCGHSIQVAKGTKRQYLTRVVFVPLVFMILLQFLFQLILVYVDIPFSQRWLLTVGVGLLLMIPMMLFFYHFTCLEEAPKY